MDQDPSNNKNIQTPSLNILNELQKEASKRKAMLVEVGVNDIYAYDETDLDSELLWLELGDPPDTETSDNTVKVFADQFHEGVEYYLTDALERDPKDVMGKLLACIEYTQEDLSLLDRRAEFVAGLSEEEAPLSHDEGLIEAQKAIASAMPEYVEVLFARYLSPMLEEESRSQFDLVKEASVLHWSKHLPPNTLLFSDELVDIMEQSALSKPYLELDVSNLNSEHLMAACELEALLKEGDPTNAEVEMLLETLGIEESYVKNAVDRLRRACNREAEIQRLHEEIGCQERDIKTTWMVTQMLHSILCDIEIVKTE